MQPQHHNSKIPHITLPDAVIGYVIDAVYEFASKYSLSHGDAANYLAKHGAIDFLTDCYEAEHTLSFADCVDDMATICRNNGGNL